MKTGRLFLLFLLLCWCNSNAQSFVQWQKTFGGIDNEYVNSCVTQTIDSGFIFSGSTFSFGAGIADVYLIKTNLYGDTLWTRTYGGIDGDWVSSVQQTSDSGFIVAGSGGTQSFGLGGSDVYVIKTNMNGDTLWTRGYGGTSNDVGSAIMQTMDGGFIITGQTISFNLGDYDVYLIKTNSNGDILWTKTIGGIGNDIGFSVQQTLDSGYIVTGTYNSFGAGNGDVLLIKTNLYGDTLWTRTYGGTNEEIGRSVQQTNDSGYVIVGSTLSFGAGSGDVYLIKTDINGDTLWTRTYGGAGFDGGNEVQQTTNGGYLIIGTTKSFGAGNSDFYLIKTDAYGDTLLTRTFGGAGNDNGYAIKQTNDGGCIIGGDTYSFGAGREDVYLIKTDSNYSSGCYEGSTATITGRPATQVLNTIYNVSSGGIAHNTITVIGNGGIVSSPCLTVGINAINNIYSDLKITPNPVSQSTIVSFSLNQPEKISANIYDITGRLVKNLFDGNVNPGNHQIEWNVTDGGIDNGIYLLNFNGNGFSISQKVVILK